MNALASRIVLTTALGLAACLGGCTSSLLQSHAASNQLYVLHAEAPPPGAAVATGSLRVLRPLPAPGLDTDRLALSRADNRLDYYLGGRWGAPLPDVFGDFAVNALRQAGAWATVTDARVSLNTDYQLLLYLDHFEAVYPQGSDPVASGAIPTATVALHGVLVRRRDGAVVANLAGAAAQQAGANRMGEVVIALQAAANAALSQVAAQAAAAR